MALGLGGALAIGGGLLGMMSADKQADAMRGATREQIEFLRDKFGVSQDLLLSMLRQQEPYRQTAESAMRSLSLMAGLPDPGPAVPTFERFGRQRELSRLRDRLGETDRFTTTGGGLRRNMKTGEILGVGGGTTVENPEFQRLQQEIAELEAEMGAEGAPGPSVEEFEGPRDVTETPGYQFFVDEGLEALAASGAARGTQLSGRQMEDITRFGQGTASQFRGQLLNELQSLAGFRPTGGTTTNLAGLLTREAGQTAPLFTQQGLISAAGTAGQAGSLGAMMQTLPLYLQGGGVPSFGGAGGAVSTQSPAGGPGGGPFAPFPRTF